MVTSVKHISILCMKDERDKLVKALQKCGEVMLDDSEDSVRSPASSADMLRRVEKLRADLGPFKPKKKALFAEAPVVDEERFETVSDDGIKKAAEMESLLSGITENEALLKEVKDLKAELTPWEALDTLLCDIGTEGTYATFTAGSVPATFAAALNEAASENGIAVDTVYNDGKRAYVIAATMNEESLLPLTEAGFEKAILPSLGAKPAEILAETDRKIQSLETALTEARARLSELASETVTTDLLYEQYKAATERDAVPYTETEQTVLLEGWVPENRIAKAEKAIKSAVDVCDIEYRDPAEDETPPTVLKNNNVVSQFEGITNMFSVPHYGGVDPNPVMAPWYWIIFGLMMGDAGYGLMMLVLGLIFRKVMKPKAGTLKICNVIIYSSVTSIIAGILFGSYFGNEIFPPVLFSAFYEPVKMLIFTLIIGYLHIVTALIAAMYYSCRDGKVFDAIADQLSWIFILTGLGLLGGSLMGLPPVLKTVGIVLAGVGAAMVLFTAGRAKKNIIGKVTGGLLGLYNVTSYLSDILSYSRILALGLATGVVGMVMNLLAGMVMDSIPVLGFVMALLIYIVGHVFNLVLGLLSAYVHDSRLQYIEFYGKFYEGNGILFRPFSVQTNTIQIKNTTTEEN